MDIDKYLPSSEVLQKYPILTTDIGIPTEKLMRFLTCVYHPKSEYSGIQDTIERKFKSAEACEFTKKKNKFVNEDIILGTNTIFNKMIIAYLKLFRSPMFAELRVYQDMLYTELENLNSAKEQDVDTIEDRKKKADTRGKINANIKIYAQRITELQSEFLVEDTSRHLLQDLYEDMMDGSAQIPSPETMAQKIKDKKPPLGLFNAYEV